LPSLQHICGVVSFPSDSGTTIIQKDTQDNNRLFGVSDTSLKEGRPTQAWILSSGNVSDITDPNLHILGSGPVDVSPPYISSAKAELASITAVSIIAQLLLKFQSSNATVELICNNKGMIAKCGTINLIKFCSQREVNIDLHLMQQDASKDTSFTCNWIRRHSDKEPWDFIEDLQNQHLSWDEIYYVWCDKLANSAWSGGFSSCFDPAVTPSERWAQYSCFCIITNSLASYVAQ
jgi:hypothetical protein